VEAYVFLGVAYYHRYTRSAFYIYTSTLPFIRRAHGLTVLHAAGEQPYLIDPAPRPAAVPVKRP
jgi:hypothetical protein